MRSCAVTLDPYTKEVSILRGDKVHICSYQEAAENPEIFESLPQNIRELLALNLEAAK